MPPKRTAAAPRHKPRENMKTGLTVPDSGIRDEYGIEPMDELFSSPAKLQPISSSTRKSAMKKHPNPNATLTSEEDMDVGQSTIPEPSAVLTERKKVSMRMPPPRSKSPVKTFLKSPARRHPSLGPVSSPTRGSIVSPSRVRAQPQVARRLDFSTEEMDGNAPQRLAHVSPKRTSQRNLVSSSPAKRPSGGSPATRSLKPAFQSQEESEDVQGSRLFDLSSSREIGDDYQPIVDNQELGSPESERAATPPEPTRQPPKKRGRPPKQHKPEPSKNADVDEDEEERPAKKPRGAENPTKQAKQRAQPKSKPQQKSKLEKPPVTDSSPAQIQRGPPRPRQKGLFSLRRETPELGSFATTRSGRASIKPLAYWKNETIVYGEDDTADADASFLLPTIKEVIRHDDVEGEKSKRGKKRGPKAHKREEDEDEDAPEPWESEPGRIYGDVRAWNPDDTTGGNSEVVEEEIAFSNDAIITREISGSTVKFAKILTMPFFGCGIVDLPPGAVKKPKNSRMMQMTFFVHKGRVTVTVGRNEPFRIGKGGMWQVPRGNLYSIENDSDTTARIFFSQGCEVAVD
ncbi:hypothetical protein V493_05499 [Pseudogymnoascus sp. VKM F-4281 (FW-2241)]|nr:hypothetical protein V493_05499 [Pseudogymnoascus sp. VKM F-4281 (FW-2241)]